MYSDKSLFLCDTDYYSQYQSIYDQVIIYDEETAFTSAESGEGSSEERVYSDSDLYETDIRQPSHPYNGDITPTA
ncbi:hypothetical protein COB28_00120 [Candidatus Dependentiae bacterium]|nr:MAG: hypothetical protein COB28_00120 [Candidatus Dependentiae bacterium]